jgi:hypothetical protein
MSVPLPRHDTYPIEGTSMVPLLQDPTGTGWNKVVGLTQYPRCPREVDQPREDWEKNSCIHSTEAADFGWMVRTSTTWHLLAHVSEILAT